MLLPFITGWIVGSVSLYTYCVMTAKEPPYPECMNCKAASCGNCVVAGTQEEDFRMAA